MEIAAAGDDQRALRRVAEALIKKAATGDVAAISVLADRLDGKVPQAIGGSEDLRPHRLIVSWKRDGNDITPEVDDAPTRLMAIAAPPTEAEE